ncbi:MAG: hypothetical protein OXE46_09485 [Chloroflexi bacterium]|nr:hypothetical protein [Chloroflexota bacterium]
MVSQTNADELGLRAQLSENAKQIAKLQGGYEHVATKADIAMLEAKIEKLRADLTWRILLAMGVLMGLVMAFIEWRVVGG